MLARAFPEAAVISFPARAESARLAEERLQPDLIILDDAMQHLAVRRDRDLVLLRPEDLREDWNRVIPSGPWREGAGALTAASAFAVKAGTDDFCRLRPRAEKRLARFGRPLFSFTLAPAGLRPLFPEKGKKGDALLAPERYRHTPYILVSGVANPAGVAATAARLIGREPVRQYIFSDHHPYSAKDAHAILSLNAAPLPLVCTAKDAVKLASFSASFGFTPVWVLETRLEFGPSLFTEAAFPDWWDECWAGLAKEP
jgi:tetraacyldisaccharide 4'-kinase